MLNTLNKLYPKLIYILLHVFALYAILVLHHQNLSCCVRTSTLQFLSCLSCIMSYLRTNCFLEHSIVHCWVWTHFIMKEARMSTYHWLIFLAFYKEWHLLLYWFKYVQSIDQTLCKAELGTAGMLDMYCLRIVEPGEACESINFWKRGWK